MDDSLRQAKKYLGKTLHDQERVHRSGCEYSPGFDRTQVFYDQSLSRLVDFFAMTQSPSETSVYLILPCNLSLLSYVAGVSAAMGAWPPIS